MADDQYEAKQESMMEDDALRQEVTQENEVITPVFVDGMLSLVGQDITKIPSDVANEFAEKTRRLDLSFNCLRSLEGLEKFTQLEELVLDNNDLDDGIKFPKLQNLHTVTLNKNKITNLDQLLDNISHNLPRLTYLSMLSNEACPNQLSSLDKDEEDYQRYRFYVLFRLPGLKFLDSTNVKEEELVEAKRVGPFMQVVKFTEDEIVHKEENDTEETTAFSPLPNSNEQEHG
ncbi:leucine-rich melanocyte differentiation-associated protein-like [Ostrea edulis]|uniref:leucine-rich melanocyte differentiation-associated protein-like n=1 Tax=Ostrea edulis TaxID=37623 RepID=UPI0024AFD248|nr:leucine-rich melanocyte differentiation-associated protein-like [Ostrea edulis]XP_056018205.1 leucine-rich melanocyte differentiation-associated protein-like [Ostrea edulis]XP_056018206.1 leucine-rich melanocyte differentiation-associated protein-like [Ostrea edulis]